MARDADPTGTPPDDPGAGIGREQLQLVIRRAAELYAAEAESGERLAPAEVLRIAEELGLPPRHVRQALYELPRLQEEEGFLDRWCGPDHLVVARAVPRDGAEVLRTLERHLLTAEYLQLRRRQADRLVLVPAEDTVSKVARAFRRPKKRHYLAHARALSVAAQPLDTGASHVQLDVDLENLRSEYVAGGAVAGGAIGLGVGLGLFYAAAIPLAEVLGTPAAAGAGALAAMGGMAASVSVSLKVAAGKFRRRIADARSEAEGLLDRVERGEALEPPASGVRRWLSGL